MNNKTVDEVMEYKKCVEMLLDEVKQQEYAEELIEITKVIVRDADSNLISLLSCLHSLYSQDEKSALAHMGGVLDLALGILRLKELQNEYKGEGEEIAELKRILASYKEMYPNFQP